MLAAGPGSLCRLCGVPGAGAETATGDAGCPACRSARRRALYVQLALAGAANLSALGPGMSLGYSAVALPAMEHMDQEQASWIASLAAIATPLGCLAAGPLLDRFGRRLTLLLLNLPCLLGWVLLGTAPAAPAAQLAQVCAGRALTGLATGLVSAPATLYSAEVAEARMRGLLATWTSVAIALGVTLVYVLGWMLPADWRLVALVCAGAPAVAAAAAALLPESPAWLATRGRADAAERALRRMRGAAGAGPLPPAARFLLPELRALREQAAAAGRPRAPGTAPWLKTLLEPATLRPLLVMNGFFFFQQASGTFVVIFYAVDMAAEAGLAAEGHAVAVMIGAVRLLLTLVAGGLSQRLGRRRPAVASGAGMTLFMGLLALLRHLGPGAGPAWLPAAALLMYVAFGTVGFLTLPWAMLGEVFPARGRGLAAGLATCLAYLYSFAAIKLYLGMVAAMGADGVFLFYAAMALLGTLFVAKWLPEPGAAAAGPRPDSKAVPEGEDEAGERTALQAVS